LAGPLGAEAAHVPSVCPAALVHAPVQQSVPVEHESPGWTQKDEAWHVPLAQRPEQQSPLDAHGSPSVLHIVLSAAHLPPTQLWLQQFPLDAHARPSPVHAG
jgi:hypothetical protein